MIFSEDFEQWLGSLPNVKSSTEEGGVLSLTLSDLEFLDGDGDVELLMMVLELVSWSDNGLLADVEGVLISLSFSSSGSF